MAAIQNLEACYLKGSRVGLLSQTGARIEQDVQYVALVYVDANCCSSQAPQAILRHWHLGRSLNQENFHLPDVASHDPAPCVGCNAGGTIPRGRRGASLACAEVGTTELN